MTRREVFLKIQEMPDYSGMRKVIKKVAGIQLMMKIQIGMSTTYKMHQ